MRRPVYIGIFLTPQSKSKLLKAFPPAHKDLHGDHVTLIFKPSEEELEKFEIGKTVRFQVSGYAVDEKGQAVAVNLPSDLRSLSKNKIPHVTISVAPGTKPVYSNELLERETQKTPSITLEGIVDTFPRTKNASIESVANQWLLKQARTVLASEVYVDRAGYAHDDEGNSWFVGKQHAGWTGSASQALRALPAAPVLSPRKPEPPEMSPAEQKEFRETAPKLIVALIGKGDGRSFKFMRDNHFKSGLTPKQKAYYDSLVAKHQQTISRLPKVPLLFDQNGEPMLPKSLSDADRKKIEQVVTLRDGGYRFWLLKPLSAKPPAPSKTQTSEQLAVLDELLGRRQDRFIQSLRDQLAKGRALSDKQLSAIRQNLYKNRMKDKADMFRQADLMPPLGYPGGQCHVVRRIVDEIKDPRLEKTLRDQVEQGKDLPNPAAKKVYSPEQTRGAWKYNMLITPHAQYRMDLRGITEPELRVVLGKAFREINAEKSRGHSERYDRLASGGEVEYYDPKLDVFMAFTLRNKNAVIITTYRKKEPTPKSRTVCPI